MYVSLRRKRPKTASSACVLLTMRGRTIDVVSLHVVGFRRSLASHDGNQCPARALTHHFDSQSQHRPPLPMARQNRAVNMRCAAVNTEPTYEPLGRILVFEHRE